MEKRYLTIGELAGQLGVERWKLAYWIERGRLPPPSTTVPGRRLFSAEDVARIRERLGAIRAEEGSDRPLPGGGAEPNGTKET